MSYQVLARKYRPQTFKDVVGQEHVVQTLTNAISSGRIAHAFLFVGPRGIGKTSIARILAKALNCPGGPKADFDPKDPVCQEITEGRSMDVLEIDGASNNSVDEIRELRENVQYAPTSGKFKIYIIDEVHMLSASAFNALLKTLEEPPAHVKFIFATTEAHKVLPTILSRCQRFDLKRISENDLVKQLKFIAQSEGITVSNDALKLLARNAEGGMRDAESAFDQLISFCGNTIEEKDVLEIFGLTGTQEIVDLAQAIQSGATESALKQVRALVARGKDLSRLTQELLRHFRNLLVFVISPQLSAEELDLDDLHHFQNLQPLPSESLILAFTEELVRVEEKIRFALVKEVLFEVAIIRLCQQHQKISLEDVIKQLSGGTIPTQANPAFTPKPVIPATQTLTASPQPEPTLTPTPAIPSPAISPAKPTLNDESLWKLVISAVKKADILLSHPLDCCHFIKRQDDTLSVQMTALKPIYDKLTQPESIRLLDLNIARTFGAPLKLDLLFNERPPEIREEKIEGTISSPPTVQPKKGNKAEASNINLNTPNPTPKPAYRNITKADFENDPLIIDAMNRFKGRIVSINES